MQIPRNKKEDFPFKKSSIHTGTFRHTNMAAQTRAQGLLAFQYGAAVILESEKTLGTRLYLIVLYTNMTAVTSFENDQYSRLSLWWNIYLAM